MQGYKLKAQGPRAQGPRAQGPRAQGPQAPTSSMKPPCLTTSFCSCRSESAVSTFPTRRRCPSTPARPATSLRPRSTMMSDSHRRGASWVVQEQYS